MRMLYLLTILVAAGCGEKNQPEPLSKTKSPLSEKGQHTNQDSKAKATAKSKLWEFITESAVFSSPVIGPDSTLYVGSRDNNLYAINGKSAGKLWQFETGGEVWCSPTIGFGGTVYIGSVDKKLYAIKTNSTGPAKSPWPMFGQNAQRTGRAK